MSQPAQPIRLELCVDSSWGARVAALAGAARIELNSAIELGGLTPSIGLVEQARKRCECAAKPCEVIAMVRPRRGGFAYDIDWLNDMRQDIRRLIEAGVDGVALGVLTRDGTVDAGLCAELIEPARAAGRQVIFHRAFDLTPDPIAALDVLIELGFDRVLTSGGRATAMEGAGVIRSLIEHAEGRIEVLPGGGIRAHNVAELVSLTGCTQVHAALLHDRRDSSGKANPTLGFDSAVLKPDRFNATDSEMVEAMIAAIEAL